MCGIVGYLGDEPAAPHILQGLRALEYRGYDSAGLAVLGPQGVDVRRCAGRIERLEALIDGVELDGSLGIGHTRWATHGAVTDANAHPHRDASGRLVIVHNGITDNFAALRERLLADGHELTSETDTEVIAHLIGIERDRGADLEEAIGAVVKRLEGAHAIVALAADEPDRLVAARVGSAGGLVIGRNEVGAVLASDLTAVVRHTHEVQVLEGGEVAVIRRDATEIRALDGRPVARRMITIPWDPMAAAKAGYRHFLAKEIHEQPETLASAIRPRITLDPLELNLEDFELPLAADAIERVVFIASGTAGYAGMVGRTYIEEIARIPAESEIASEFAYRSMPLSPKTLVVAISQSGETADVLVAVPRVKRQGAALVGIVNVVGSELTRRADVVLYTHAGPEISVASTKAFTAQLATLYLLACWLGRERGELDDARLAQLLGDIAHVPLLAARTLRCEAQMKELARRYHRYRNFVFIGRGAAHALALEGALKLKEISYIHAEGFAAGELKHGPIALIEPDTPAVAIATAGAARDKTLNAVEQIKARDGPVILIASEGDARAAEIADDVVFVPAASELVTPMLAVIPLQLFAYHVAVRLGCDVDQPRNLAKSVTVE